MTKMREKVLSCFLAVSLVLGCSMATFAGPLPAAAASENDETELAVVLDEGEETTDPETDETEATNEEPVAEDEDTVEKDPAEAGDDSALATDGDEEEIVTTDEEPAPTTDTTSARIDDSAVSPSTVIAPDEEAVGPVMLSDVEIIESPMTVKFVEAATAFSPQRELAPSITAVVKRIPNPFGEGFLVREIAGVDYQQYDLEHPIEGYFSLGPTIEGDECYMWYKSSTRVETEFSYCELDLVDDRLSSTSVQEEYIALDAETDYTLSEIIDKYPTPNGYHFLYAKVVNNHGNSYLMKENDSFTTSPARNFFGITIFLTSDSSDFTMPSNIEDATCDVTAHFVDLYGRTIAPDEVINIKFSEVGDGLWYRQWEKVAPKEKAGLPVIGVASHTWNPDHVLTNVKNGYFFSPSFTASDGIGEVPVSGEATFIYNGSIDPAPAADKKITLKYQETDYRWYRSPEGEIQYTYVTEKDEIVHTSVIEVPGSMFVTPGALYDMGDYKFTPPFYPVFTETGQLGDFTCLAQVSDLKDGQTEGEYTLRAVSREEVMMVKYLDADTDEELAEPETVIFHLPKGMSFKEYAANHIADKSFAGYEFVELSNEGSIGKAGWIWAAKYKKPVPDEPLLETGMTPPAPVDEVIEDDPVPETEMLVQTGDMTPLALLAGLSAASAAALVACLIRRKMSE